MSWGKTKEIGRGRIVGTYRIGIRQEWIVNAMCSSRYKSKYKKLLYCRYGKRRLIVSSLLKEKHDWSLVSLWSLRFSLGLCLKGPMLATKGLCKGPMLETLIRFPYRQYSNFFIFRRIEYIGLLDILFHWNLIEKLFYEMFGMHYCNCSS